MLNMAYDEVAYDQEANAPRGSPNHLEEGLKSWAAEGAAHLPNTVLKEECEVEEKFPDATIYPEGGFKAWSVVLGAWCAMVPSMGLLNTLGSLHAWTSTHQLSNYSQSSVGWIFGAYAFFLYVSGAQVGECQSQ